MNMAMAKRLAIISLTLAASYLGGGETVAASNTASRSDASPTGQISVLYSSDFMFNSTQLTDRWWNGIKKEFEKKYRGATLNLIPVPGNAADVATKAGLLFRSRSQAPDLVQLNTAYISQFQSAGYLRPLNQYLKSAGFWRDYPPNIRKLGAVNGKVYGVSVGNNISALFYNKQMFKKAGLPAQWRPKSWANILQAAKKIKRAIPNIVPLWLPGGTAAGPGVMLQGTGNLIYGSRPGLMFDARTRKWVVDSPGLRATLSFYKSVYSAGLGASTSQLFLPNAVGQPPLYLKQGHVAIAFGANWYPTAWADPTEVAHWPNAGKVVGVAPIPTQKGRGSHFVSALGGWATAVSSFSKHPALALALLKVMEEPTNLLHVAVWSGFVPPSTKVGKLKAYRDFAPFMSNFSRFAVYGKPLPANPNYPVYVQAVGTATGQIEKDPSTSVGQATDLIKSTVTQQLGGQSVESLP